MFGSFLIYTLIGGFFAFIGGFVAGFTGFGFGLVFAPVLSLLLGRPHEAVFLTLVLSTLLSFVVFADVRRSVTPTTVMALVLVSVIGTMFGVLLFGLMNVSILKIVISVVAIIVALLRITPLSVRISCGLRPLAIAGLIGSVLNGCTGMGGPAPAIVVALQQRGVHESRAILVTINLVSYVVAIIATIGYGLVRVSWLASSFWFVPFVGCGVVAGVWSVRLVSRDVFDRFVTVIIGASGLVGLAMVLIG